MFQELSEEEVKWLQEIAEELGISYERVEQAYRNILSGKQPENMIEEFLVGWLEAASEELEHRQQ